MSKLGLGLIAADSYFREGDARQLREQQGQRFEWEKQRATADLSTLDDRAQAQRAQAKLQTAQNTAGLGLVDKQTNLANTTLDTQQAAADAAKARQPEELAAQADQAKVGALLARFKLEQTPAEMARARANGTLTDADIYTTSVVKLASLLDSNDSNEVVRFMNGMNEAGVFGNKHAPVVSVGIQSGKDGESMFVAKDAQGKPVMQMSASAMKRIRDRATKADFKTVNAGDSLVRVQGGQVESVFTAPESEKSRSAAAAKTGPLERDVKYLMSDHGMTNEQALAHLNQAKAMSRDQFILKSVQDRISMGKKPTEAEIGEFGAMFDRAVGRSAPGKPAQSNSSPPANMDAQIRSLIGIP